MSQPGEWDRQRQQVESYLSDYGPAPLSEIPVGVSRARERGVKQFSPHRGALGNHPAVGIYYLPTHTPEAVIQAWVDVNRDCLDGLSRSSVTRRIKETYDSKWVATWHECAEAAGLEAHQSAPEEADKDPERSCPKCGDSIRARRFVKHLQECGRE